ncbi:GNAT family N-acetyltransferase [Paenibacillus sp.]|jgi:predicted acetyltransferase|uniref:GNAT family N-acetyltransferase n=1 Tax=Paenibacillus sp. TaxID=58172 RepID=UPI002837845D|nr:GNAT family N-acetyltransferase [Paenibacillus sp.]MDR0266527.1 GNAT family N-acetyltransferase [Paenibacillus sp.]
MEIEIVPVKQSEKHILENLYQLYEYDFSEYTKLDIDKDGKYPVNIDFYWEGDGRWKPYFIKMSGTVMGFVIALLENMDVNPDPDHVVYDFMILKKYRRQGVGYSAAFKTFELYQANWKLAQMEANQGAIFFWRKVIHDFTNGKYTENYREDRKMYVQSFSTKQSGQNV